MLERASGFSFIQYYSSEIFIAMEGPKFHVVYGNASAETTGVICHQLGLLCTDLYATCRGGLVEMDCSHVVLKCARHYFLLEDVEESGVEQISLVYCNGGSEQFSIVVVIVDYPGRLVVEAFYGSDYGLPSCLNQL